MIMGMDLRRLNAALGAYAEGSALSFERTAASCANEAFIVTSEEGEKYVVRLLKTQTPESARTEALIQEKLAAVGIGTANYLMLKTGDVVGSLGDDNFTISTFIEGESPREISLHLMEDFGATLAKLHDALDSVQVPFNELQWLSLDNAKKDLAAYKGKQKEVMPG